jgi:hypothetical protein
VRAALAKFGQRFVVVSYPERTTGDGMTEKEAPIAVIGPDDLSHPRAKKHDLRGAARRLFRFRR